MTMADETNEAAAAAVPEEEEDEKHNRNCIPIHEKVSLCIEAERVVRAEKKMSLKAFCREKGIWPSNLRSWQKNLAKLKQAMDRTSKKKTRLVATTGRRSELWGIRDKLLPWIDNRQKEGAIVSVRQISIGAKRSDKSPRKMKWCALFAKV